MFSGFKAEVKDYFMEKGLLLMRAFMLFIMVFLFSTTVHYAQENASWQQQFEQANQYYADEMYFDAVNTYTELLEAGVVSRDIYFNLGNAYYRLGRTGKAILNYKRALIIAPNDRDVLHNLELANMRTQDKITPAEINFLAATWKSWFKLANPNTWSVLSAVFMWLGVILIFLAVFILNPFSLKLFSFIFAVLFFIGSITTFFSASAHWNWRYETLRAIMIDTNAYVKSEPNLRSDDLFMVREGTKMKVLRSENDFSLIELADGKSGWLKNAHFEGI